MSWSECVMAFSAARQRHMMVLYCYGSGSTNELFWKAQDYSSCIVLHPLQVGCHIMSITKQQ